MSIKIDIVSAEAEIFSGEVEMVFAPALLGEVGIAPGHTPMMSRLGPGEVRVQFEDGTDEAFYVSGGLLEVQPKLVTVLSDTAQRAGVLDEDAAVRAKQAAEDAMANREAGMDFAIAQAQFAEAAAQLQMIQKLRRRRG